MVFPAGLPLEGRFEEGKARGIPEQRRAPVPSADNILICGAWLPWNPGKAETMFAGVCDRLDRVQMKSPEGGHPVGLA